MTSYNPMTPREVLTLATKLVGKRVSEIDSVLQNPREFIRHRIVRIDGKAQPTSSKFDVYKRVNIEVLNNIVVGVYLG